MINREAFLELSTLSTALLLLLSLEDLQRVLIIIDDDNLAKACFFLCPSPIVPLFAFHLRKLAGSHERKRVS